MDLIEKVGTAIGVIVNLLLGFWFFTVSDGAGHNTPPFLFLIFAIIGGSLGYCLAKKIKKILKK